MTRICADVTPNTGQSKEGMLSKKKPFILLIRSPADGCRVIARRLASAPGIARPSVECQGSRAPLTPPGGGADRKTGESAPAWHYTT
jgi:hypothetical protein